MSEITLSLETTLEQAGVTSIADREAAVEKLITHYAASRPVNRIQTRSAVMRAINMLRTGHSANRAIQAGKACIRECVEKKGTGIGGAA